MGLIEERNARGPFTSIYDFVERVNLNAINKKNMEAMAVAGAFDCFEGLSRSQFFAENAKGETFIENLIRYGNRVKSEQETTQQSLFGDDTGFEVVRPVPPESTEWPKLEKLNREKDVIGIFLSAHPLDDYRLEMRTFCNITMSDLADLEPLLGKEVVMAGMVTEARSGTSKNGKPFGSLTLQDYTDSYRFMMFDRDYVENSKYFAPGYFLLVKGKVQKRKYREDETEVRIISINLLTSVKDEMMKRITMVINIDSLDERMVSDLVKLFESNPGNTEVKVIVADPGEKISVSLFSRAYKIRLSNSFIRFLEDHPGIDYKVN